MERTQRNATYIEQLVDFVLDCKLDTIPEDVREKASLFLLDTLGVAVANSSKDFVRTCAKTIDRTAAAGQCTAIGYPRMYVAEGAAAVNSTAIHGSDFDPTHLESIMHPTSVVVPVALAVAEEVGASGPDLLSAVVAGFEVLIRMGLVKKGGFHDGGYQPTAVSAPIPLAMIAGKLYGMSREQVVSAAGLAASIAAGLRTFTDDGTWAKRIITGWSCRAALTATAFAGEGYPGSRDALEKEPAGFYPAHIRGSCELSELTKGLGREWETRNTDLKRYPCSHGHHAFMNTARRAVTALKLQPENIASVVVHVSAKAAKFWFEPRETKYELQHVYGARFAMPYTVALALAFGNVTDEHLESREFLDDPRVRNLVQRIRPEVDETLQNANPNILRGDLEITTTDGRSAKFEGTGALAGEEFKAAVVEKFRMNTRAALGAEAVDKLVALTTRVEEQPDIRQIMGLLRY